MDSTEFTACANINESIPATSIYDVTINVISYVPIDSVNAVAPYCSFLSANLVIIPSTDYFEMAATITELEEGQNNQTTPTPEDVVAAVGAGFFLVLPLMLVIFGGRTILSMLFPKS
jgi:hypothetical protein